MTFSQEISIGHLITLGVALIGGIGGYYTLRARVETMWKKVEDLGKDVDGIEKRVADQDLHMAEKLVKKEDLAVMEGRLTKQIEGVGTNIQMLVNTVMNLKTDPSTRRTTR